MTDHDHELYDFRHRVDRIHAATPGSEGAPADLWHRVRAQIETTEEETTAMSSISTPVDSIPVSNQNAPSGQHRFARHANLAATIALVLAVALGGWFAATRMNQPGSPEPRFAVLPGTPEVADATCDVEPMTVDEALIIMENPYRSMTVSEDMGGDYGTWEWLSGLDVEIGQPQRNELITDGPNMVLGQADLDHAMDLGNTFLACIHHGTQAQVYALLVHSRLRSMLPLYASEEEARAIVQEELNRSGNTEWVEDSQIEYLSDKTISMNPKTEFQYLDSSPMLHNYMIDAVVMAPIVIHDADGSLVFETDFGGYPIKNNGRSQAYARNVMLAKSSFTGEWYVFDIYRP